MKKIKIQKNDKIYNIKVDDEDYDWLIQYNWIWRNGYACTKIGNRYTGMHRIIMGVTHGDDIIVDHVDGSHENNQKNNLRFADRCQNQQNRKTNKANTLPKGIRLLPSGKYNVRLQTYKKRVIVGTFPTLDEAINERNRVAKHLHKDFYRPSHHIV